MSDRREFLATIDRLDRLEAELAVLREEQAGNTGYSRAGVLERIAELRAQLAGQSSTVARRVYADWLEEQGEHEHAELIRVGCDLAGIYDDTPDLDTERYAANHPNRCREVRGKVATLRRREAELLSVESLMRWAKTHVLPLNNEVGRETRLLTWDRGLCIGAGCNSGQSRHHLATASLFHPIRTLRLFDWLGIDRSLPPDPANALPFLRRLELPRSAAVPRLGVAVEHLVDSMPAADHFWITMESDFHRLFGRSPDGTPRVALAFWNDAAAFRATFPPDAEPVVTPPV